MANLIRVIQDSQSVGAVVTIGATYYIPNNMGCDIHCNVTGKDASNNICSFSKIITMQNINGIVSIIGGTAIHTHKGILTGVSILEGIVGTSFILNLTGMAAKTINWHTILLIHVN